MATAIALVGLSILVLKKHPGRAERDFPELVKNGGFEHSSPLSKRGTWRVSPERLFSWNLFSSTGKKALLVDASRLDSGRNAEVSCVLKGIRPGSYYLLQLDLHRDRNIVGLYPAVSLFGQERRLNDFWAQDRWQKISLILRSPPTLEENNTSFFKIIIPHGQYKLWIDSVSLKKLDVLTLFPRNNARLGKEKITFSWKAPATDRLLGVKVVLSRNSDFKGKEIIEFKTDNRRDRLTLPRERFGVGEWFWRVEMYLYRNLVSVSLPARFFIRTSSHEAEEGKEKEIGLTEVRYQQFFPLGIYNAEAGDFSELRDIGFNSVHVSGVDRGKLISVLEAAHKNDLRVLIPFRSRTPLLEEVLEQESEKAWLLRSETVLGWYLDDEPEGRSVSPKEILGRKEYLRQKGLQQPGTIALCRSWRAVDYAQATDVIMSDPYPIPFNPLSWLSESLDEIYDVIAEDRTKTAWAVIQAFNWETSSSQARETGLACEPSSEEVKALTYLALVHRARGIFYYTLRSGGYYLREKRELWDGIKETVRELIEIYPLLLAPEPEDKIILTTDEKDAWDIPAVHFTAKLFQEKKEGRSNKHIAPGIYLIAVNTVNREATAELSLKNLSWTKFSELEDLFSGEKISLSSGKQRLEFSPYERKVLLLRQ
ncbi:MAG: hypothetical protein ACE5LC_04890 [Candidatus Aminicenantales bacterium]